MHAKNLATFATIYKVSLLVLKRIGANPGKEGSLTPSLSLRPLPLVRPTAQSQANTPQGPYDTFLAGLLGGYYVFGRPSRSGRIPSVNQQIVVYIFARVALALARISVQPGVGLPLVSRPDVSARIRNVAWPAFASLSWGAVMYLFRYYPGDLQSSLKGSMDYIYLDSNEWDGLRNFLWHNK
ncbi:hypothetical protein IMZ48_46285 [Candidatus Bathyarchaeota archaeon]|nr:hypothetical protein [Candidatus Bathyarchaeota archaeon]